MIIFKEIKKQPFDYILLLVVSLVTIISFLLFGNHGHSHFQRQVLYAFVVLFYLSLVHHSRRRDLQLSIIVEYFLFALLALIIISGFRFLPFLNFLGSLTARPPVLFTLIFGRSSVLRMFYIFPGENFPPHLIHLSQTPELTVKLNQSIPSPEFPTT